MEKFLAYKEFIDYSSAAKEARSIAVEYEYSVSIYRSEIGWVVMIPPVLHSQLVIPKKIPSKRSSLDEKSDPDYWIDEDTSYSSSKDDRDLMEEMLDDQDSYARSEQDGWFYEE